MAAKEPTAPRGGASPANAIARDEARTASGAAPALPQATPMAPAPATKDRTSRDAGDVPEALRKRYFSSTSKWSGEPAYFTTAQAKEPAFRDQGRRLITASESEEVVRDLVAIAQHRGWAQVHVTGSETFRRAAWLEASRQRLEVRGYRPNERDLQELERIGRAASRNSIAPAAPAASPRAADHREREASDGTSRSPVERAQAKNARAAQSQLRVIETVVRTALFDDPAAVARVMKVANDKVQTHLHAGRQFEPAKVRDTPVRTVEPSGPKRSDAAKIRAPQQRARSR